MDASQAFVGIDVSKKSIDVYVLPTRQHLRIDTVKDPAFAAFFALVDEARAAGHSIERVVLEASGGYENRLVAALVLRGLPVVVANPRRVRDFASAIGRMAKTDRVDARKIALFAQKVCPEVRPLPDAEESELRELTTRRRQLLDMIVAEENRLETTVSVKVRESIARSVASLGEELELVEAATAELISKNPVWSERIKLLKSASGVGDITALALVAYLPELGQLSRKQVASLVGLAPWSNDSGERRGKRSIWGGRAAVRTALYMATLSAIRHNHAIREMYERLTKAGKEKMVAFTACSRKLITILNAMVKNKEPFRTKKQPAAA